MAAACSSIRAVWMNTPRPTRVAAGAETYGGSGVAPNLESGRRIGAKPECLTVQPIR